MFRRLVLGVLGLLALGILLAFLGLLWTHADIRRQDPELPSLGQVVEAGRASRDLPIRLSHVNTASQEMPRGFVLTPSQDSARGASMVMSHPAFVLEWRDGRRLLIDSGMDRDTALGFGRPMEMAGAAPLEPRTSLAEELGDDLSRGSWALLITHLHLDHTDGVQAVCARQPAAGLRLFQGPAQASQLNFTTWLASRDLRSASCLTQQELEAASLMPVPDHPGVFVIPAAGHTPGSQIVVAFLGGEAATRGYAFTGDVANHIDGIRHDIPKPLAYRLLVVPESDRRLGRMRRFLRDLEGVGLALVVSHDEGHLGSLGIPAWSDRDSFPRAAQETPGKVDP